MITPLAFAEDSLKAERPGNILVEMRLFLETPAASKNPLARFSIPLGTDAASGNPALNAIRDLGSGLIDGAFFHC